MSMDQIGQKQKVNEQNRVKPRPRTVSAREIRLHRDLSGIVARRQRLQPDPNPLRRVTGEASARRQRGAGQRKPTLMWPA